jgi:replicative DNA helicase
MQLGTASESRQQEIATISRMLKQMARELECPVIALSQLSRNPEGRGKTDHRPVLADIRDSGAIEQDADVVLFLYRDEVYNPETENPGECEVIIAKQRNGPIGPVYVRWLAKYTKFVNKS